MSARSTSFEQLILTPQAERVAVDIIRELYGVSGEPKPLPGQFVRAQLRPGYFGEVRELYAMDILLANKQRDEAVAEAIDAGEWSAVSRLRTPPDDEYEWIVDDVALGDILNAMGTSWIEIEKEMESTVQAVLRESGEARALRSQWPGRRPTAIELWQRSWLEWNESNGESGRSYRRSRGTALLQAYQRLEPVMKRRYGLQDDMLGLQQTALARAWLDFVRITGMISRDAAIPAFKTFSKSPFVGPIVTILANHLWSRSRNAPDTDHPALRRLFDNRRECLDDPLNAARLCGDFYELLRLLLLHCDIVIGLPLPRRFDPDRRRRPDTLTSLVSANAIRQRLR